MATIQQQAKSKTVLFNAVVMGAVGILGALGVELPAEVTAGVLAVGNYILRLITKEPLEAK